MRVLYGLSGLFLNVKQMWACGVSLESSRSGDSEGGVGWDNKGRWVAVGRV